MDTIFALATAQGRAGVAVVRISGPDAELALDSLSTRVPPRKAALRRLVADGNVLDEALVLFFPKPASFTGEDIVELQLHGSTAVVGAVLSYLSSLPGFRAAEAGEFTRRALENERLDLAQIEGLSDLVEAETEAQRRQAFRVFEGELGRKADNWRENLIRAAALLEATIDFADEDVPVDVKPETRELLADVLISLRQEVKGVGAAERIRDGFEVAIIGAPNVGKSSLLNYLAGREAAITSEIAGTTRDVIEVRMDLGGLPVTLLDTAGIRETEDAIESMGVSLAKERAKKADLRVLLTDGGIAPSVDLEPDDLVVRTKADLGDGDISAKTGAGVDVLVEKIVETLSARASNVGVAIKERHRLAIMQAIGCLESAQDRLDSEPDLTELIAEDVRNGIRALDSLVGRVDVEHLLDEIFSSFCIGK